MLYYFQPYNFGIEAVNEIVLFSRARINSFSPAFSFKCFYVCLILPWRYLFAK